MHNPIDPTGPFGATADCIVKVELVDFLHRHARISGDRAAKLIHNASVGIRIVRLPVPSPRRAELPKAAITSGLIRDRFKNDEYFSLRYSIGQCPWQREVFQQVWIR